MVSVIITTHNRVNLLGRAIKSVLSQTYKDIELIIVSDGSTDGTDEFMKQYESDSIVNYISYYPGRGGNYARNIGIKTAKGEYIAFLDDDDEWLTTKVEKQVKIMNSDPDIGLVYTGTHSIFVDDGIEFNSCPKNQGDLSKKILHHNIIGSTTTVMVRKSVFDKSGLFDETLCAIQDYDLWVRICQSVKVGVISAPMVNYYNYKNTRQISTNLEKYEIEYNYVNQKYDKLIKNNLSILEIKQKLASQKRVLALKALRNGNGREARLFLRRSLKCCFEKRTILYYLLSYFGYNFMLKIRSHRNN